MINLPENNDIVEEQFIKDGEYIIDTLIKHGLISAMPQEAYRMLSEHIGFCIQSQAVQWAKNFMRLQKIENRINRD